MVIKCKYELDSTPKMVLPYEYFNAQISKVLSRESCRFYRNIFKKDEKQQ